MRDVAIVGVSMIKFGRYPDRDVAQLAGQAALQAAKDGGVEMKDVEALCRRAIIINEGEIKHDGPLAGIIDRFSRHKVVLLQFTDSVIPADLDNFGRVFDVHPPRVKLEVDRTRIPEILSQLLSRYPIEDVGVQDRPLGDRAVHIDCHLGADLRQHPQVIWEDDADHCSVPRCGCGRPAGASVAPGAVPAAGRRADGGSGPGPVARQRGSQV